MRPALMVKGAMAPMTTTEGVVMMQGGKAWMTTDWFIQWVDFYFPMPPRNKILLIVDSARSHISKKAKAHIHARGILFCAIPGGMTAHLQPADYAWFKPLKDSLTLSIDQWKMSEDFEFTRGGNVRPPTNQRIRNWLKTAWANVTQDTIVTSFRRCFLGADDQLSLTTHEVYGEPFVNAMAHARESGRSDEDVGDEYQHGDEDDGLVEYNDDDVIIECIP
jgi:DDE superfamily endonuclease